MTKATEEIYKQVGSMRSIGSVSYTFSVQAMFFLDLADWSEGQISTTYLNPLEPSLHLNITQKNLFFLGAGLFEYVWRERIA